MGDPTTTSGGANPKQITPELVRRVADLVYDMWLRDAQLDRERTQLAVGKRTMQQGRGR